jgi:hypothetical protein
LLFGEIDKLTRSEYVVGQLRLPAGRIVWLALSQLANLFGVWKILGVKTQFTVFRIGESHSHGLALHDLANARGNFLKQLAQVQLGHDPIRYIEKKSQPPLHPSVVHRDRNLIRDER